MKEIIKLEKELKSIERDIELLQDLKYDHYLQFLKRRKSVIEAKYNKVKKEQDVKREKKV